jgi:hypothetical protein
MSIESRLDKIEKQAMAADCWHCETHMKALESVTDQELWLQSFFTPCLYCLKQRTWLDLVKLAGATKLDTLQE